MGFGEFAGAVIDGDDDNGLSLVTPASFLLKGFSNACFVEDKKLINVGRTR